MFCIHDIICKVRGGFQAIIGDDLQVGIGPYYLIFQILIKSAHDRYDYYERGDADGDTEYGDKTYEGYELLFALCGQVPEAYEQLPGHLSYFSSFPWPS